MQFRYSSSRILHDDHMASLALLGDVERLVLARKAAPAQGDADFARFAGRLRGALDGEISDHFDFEEEVLFPLLAQFGAGDLGDLLTEEHHVLRAVMREVGERAAAGVAQGYSDTGWNDFRRLCGELVERLSGHVEKEERALVPALEDTFTPDLDAEAAARHAV